MISFHRRSRAALACALLFAACALWPRVASAGPTVSIALRGLVDDRIEQGEPLRVMVLLEAENEGGPVELAPATGTWTDAVRVELFAAGDPSVLARAAVVGAPDTPGARLDEERIASGLWVFSGSALQKPGDYTVRARLVMKGDSGWSGDVSSESSSFRVIAISSAPPHVRARALSRAQLALARNALEEAAGLLDAELAKAPDDFELLCVRAEVALACGNTAAATLCAVRAARLLPAHAAGPPPPILHDVQQRILTAQLEPTAAPATVPDWSWPPEPVMRLLAKEAIDALPAPAPVGSAPPPKAGGSPTPTPHAAAAATTASPQPPAPPAVPTVAPAVAPPRPSPGPADATLAAAEVTPPRPGSPSPGTVVPSRELTDAAVAADPAGQWASDATAGSQYGKVQYSARQATGAPNVRVAGNSPDAWCPAVQSKGMDWLEVSFAEPVRATEVRVRQNDASGAIVKVEAFDPEGRAHVWWEGVDPHQAGPVRQVVWFAVRVAPTPYPVARIRLTLNLASGPGYKEIDAVQLVGTSP